VATRGLNGWMDGWAKIQTSKTWYFLYGIDGYDVNISNNCEDDDNLYLRVILKIKFPCSRVSTVTTKPHVSRQFMKVM
jgi:hypothetical protein